MEAVCTKWLRLFEQKLSFPIVINSRAIEDDDNEDGLLTVTLRGPHCRMLRVL